MLIDNQRIVFEKEFEISVANAAKMLDGEFIPEGTEDAYLDCWENIHHCGTCITREVLNTVWPSVEKYIDCLEFIIHELDASDVLSALKKKKDMLTHHLPE